jgi:hypothetical protein
VSTTRAGRRSALVLATPVVAALLATTGCSPSSSQSANGSSAAENAAPARGADSARTPLAAADSELQSQGKGGTQVQQRAVISTGRIDLASTDVARARTRVDAVVGKVGGRLADEDTTTDDSGTVTRTRLVVRVPSNRFGRAMTRLAGVATLRSSSRTTEDVTTRVIDVNARIAAQRAGVRRLRHLVSGTANLPALLAVERELSAREGQLESLLQQRAYLADRTSLATISLDITLRATPAPKPSTRSAGGFVGGLHHGWHALVAVVVALLVAVGAVLPFALAGLLVGIPVWLVVRRARRTRQPEAPAES